MHKRRTAQRVVQDDSGTASERSKNSITRSERRNSIEEDSSWKSGKKEQY